MLAVCFMYPGQEKLRPSYEKKYNIQTSMDVGAQTPLSDSTAILTLEGITVQRETIRDGALVLHFGVLWVGSNGFHLRKQSPFSVQLWILLHLQQTKSLDTWTGSIT